MNSASEQADRLNGPATTGVPAPEASGPHSSRWSFFGNYPLQARDNSGSIFQPPNSLSNAETRDFLFHGSSFLFLGALWLLVCVGLYIYASGYHVNTLYEARWMLSTLLITGFLCVLLHFERAEAVFVSCWVSNIYALCASFITAVIYSLNFHRTASAKMVGFKRKIMSPGRQPYMILSLCLIVISLFGLTAVVWLGMRLYRLASWHYKNLNIHRRLRLNLFLVSAAQWWLAVFTIYVTKQVILLKAAFIHTYMIQELFCALILLALSMHQMFFLFRPNKIALKFILFLNVCQTLQELFYAWNAYYVSLYIHLASNKLVLGLNYDQVLMTLNFGGHIARLSLCACTCWKLVTVTDLGLRLSNTFLQVDVNRGVLKFIILIAAISLLLSGAHVFMDVVYASMQHIYRTLIAFTGISVFYTSIVGVSLSIFLLGRRTIFLVFAAVFSLLLAAVSLHALYIYLETTFSGFLIYHLHNLGRNKVKPSVMHYFEAIFALSGLTLGSVTSFFLARLLRMESAHESRDKFGWPLRWLKYQAVLLLLTTVLEAVCLTFVKVQWKLTDTTLSYGVLDLISTSVMGAVQLYVAYPTNCHLSYSMLVLFFLLLAEVLTTFSYLSSYTSYIQFLIMVANMLRPTEGKTPLVQNKSAKGPFSTTTTTPKAATSSPLMDLFPVSQMVLVILGHVTQLIQWVLGISSLICVALCLERMQQNRASHAERGTHIGTVSGSGEAAYVNIAYDRETGERLEEEAGEDVTSNLNTIA